MPSSSSQTKKRKNKTGKKYLVVRDELNIKGPGIYAILPFERLDTNKKSMFKIGYAMDVNRRIENYHTYFPAGVYCVAFLSEPFPVRPPTRNRPNPPTRKEKFVEIEKYILSKLKEKGASQLYSTTRVQKGNDKKWGQTEWFYTTADLIHECFLLAQRRFGGKLEIFNTTEVNKTAKNRKTQSFYNGEIYFIN